MKPSPPRLAPHAGFPFPRLLRRGPIEAFTNASVTILTPEFPRLLRRGPIEALRPRQIFWMLLEFPRLLRRGPIEALILSGKAAGGGTGFPACLGGAPLKPICFMPPARESTGFPACLGGAPLKHGQNDRHDHCPDRFPRLLRRGPIEAVDLATGEVPASEVSPPA